MKYMLNLIRKYTNGYYPFDTPPINCRPSIERNFMRRVIRVYDRESPVKNTKSLRRSFYKTIYYLYNFGVPLPCIEAAVRKYYLLLRCKPKTLEIVKNRLLKLNIPKEDTILKLIENPEIFTVDYRTVSKIAILI